MTNAEQWLADLEAKAQEAEQGEWKAITKEFFGDVSSEVEASGGTVAYDLNPDDAAFIAAANPATVLRLVAMVRFLAFSAARSRGLFDDPAYWLDTAYAATEAKMKKEAQ